MDAKALLAKYAQGERDFTGIALGECQLIGAELPDIILRGATLNVANFSSANLSRADLSQALLNVSRLTGVNLTEANLSGCKLNVGQPDSSQIGGCEPGHGLHDSRRNAASQPDQCPCGGH